MQVVGEVEGEADVDELLRASKADVVVFDQAGLASSGHGERLMRDHRGLRLLVLSDSGRAAALHWLEPRSVVCANVSPERLVNAIRGSFDGGRAP